MQTLILSSYCVLIFITRTLLFSSCIAYSCWLFLTSSIQISKSTFCLFGHPWSFFWFLANGVSSLFIYYKPPKIFLLLFSFVRISIFCDKEVPAGHYYKSFSTLLPGMKVSPLCVSFKKGSPKPCVCTDLSFGNPSPDELVDKDLVSIPLDSLKIFSPHLIDASLNLQSIVLWKCDVEGAYCLLSMSPQWKIRQIVSI